MLFTFDYSIPNKGKFYLNEIIEPDYYEQWFSSKKINILNKSLCGNGGTTGFVDFALKRFKGVLILVPNISIVKSKEQQYRDDDNICCVYGESDSIDPNALIVIATYDQFPKLTKMLSDSGMDWENFWSGRTIIVDEYHKLIDENNFRDICFKVTELIKKTGNSVVLISATPHWGYVDFLREYVKGKELVTYTIDYNTDYEDQMNHAINIYPVRKDLKSILKKVHDHNNQVCVFYNNVNAIKKILNQIGDESFEVLCSKSHSKELGDYYSSEFNGQKKFHFMTSAYFTGHDIDIHIDNCIIIGSQQFSYTSYNERDIKQMLGRFRKGVSGIHVFVLEKSVDRRDKLKVMKQYDACMNDLLDFGDEWSNFRIGAEKKQELLNLTDTLERYGKWQSLKKVAEMFVGLKGDTEEYRVVLKKDIKDFETIENRTKLTFKAACRNIVSGEKVSYDQYQYNYMLTRYFEKYGADRLLNSSISQIKEWYKIQSNTDNVDLDILTPQELFDVFGFRNFGIYKASYLMSCVRYLGNKCSYDELSRVVHNVFYCYLVLFDSKNRDDQSTYLVIRSTGFVKNIQKSNGGNIDIETSTITKLSIFSMKISYQTERSNHCYAITVPFQEASERFRTLSGNPLYDWVNEDKQTRLPLRKKDKDWLNLKNFSQNKISEMYKDSDSRYRYTKGEMDKVDSIIVDIDSGVSFSEFQRQYNDVTYIAYPSISNMTYDWTKFRVIFPLKHTLTLTGQYNSKVLMALRTIVCPYEDPHHSMYSYVNREDFSKRVENNGEVIDIPQELVDFINISITNDNSYVDQKFISPHTTSHSYNKLTEGSDNKWTKFTITRAQDYFQQSMNDPAEGARNRALFIIKNRLSEPDLIEFEQWLRGNFRSEYTTKWKNHKVVG